MFWLPELESEPGLYLGTAAVTRVAVNRIRKVMQKIVAKSDGRQAAVAAFRFFNMKSHPNRVVDNIGYHINFVKNCNLFLIN
jgi:hypothetical protein